MDDDIDASLFTELEFPFPHAKSIVSDHSWKEGVTAVLYVRFKMAYRSCSAKKKAFSIMGLLWIN